MNTEKIKQIALSYLRASLSVVVGLYMTGVQDPKTLATAFVAGLVGPILKALDSSAPQFGKGSK